MNRANSKAIFNKIVKLINDFKQYFLQYGEKVDENPSPGNKAGGISTLEDKSLGCTQKSGTAAVKDVLPYSSKIKTSGLSLLQSPGNDLVASTALAAAGCQIVLFTTGRGTPFGTFVPTVKISTNTQLAKLKPHWIDFDAGVLTTKNTAKVLPEFIEFVINVASGKKCLNEINGERNIAIFKDGVTL
jgi:altronate hydrolase